MTHRTHMAFALLVGTLISDAHAAPPPPVPLAVEAREAAVDNVLIRGTIVQAFDPVKRKPEIIRADEVFIGDNHLRFFRIYRSSIEYDRERRRIRQPEVLENPRFNVGYHFDRVVLMPATGAGSGSGLWTFRVYGNDLTDGRGLAAFTAEAIQQGRFRSAPPPRHPCCVYWLWGSCSEPCKP